MTERDVDPDNNRIAPRQAMLKGAQMVFGSSVIDCLVLNMSDTGARIRTASVVHVPEQITLQMRGGASFAASRVWTRGVEIGLALAPLVSLKDEQAALAWRLYDLVRASDLAEPLSMLRAQDFFGDLTLRNAAEQAESTLRRLETLLASRARGRPRE